MDTGDYFIAFGILFVFVFVMSQPTAEKYWRLRKERKAREQREENARQRRLGYEFARDLAHYELSFQNRRDLRAATQALTEYLAVDTISSSWYLAGVERYLQEIRDQSAREVAHVESSQGLRNVQTVMVVNNPARPFIRPGDPPQASTAFDRNAEGLLDEEVERRIMEAFGRDAGASEEEIQRAVSRTTRQAETTVSPPTPTQAPPTGQTRRMRIRPRKGD